MAVAAILFAISAPNRRLRFSLRMEIGIETGPT
jgi:hypothetical protein